MGPWQTMMLLFNVCILTPSKLRITIRQINEPFRSSQDKEGRFLSLRVPAGQDPACIYYGVYMHEKRVVACSKEALCNISSETKSVNMIDHSQFPACRWIACTSSRMMPQRVGKMAPAIWQWRNRCADVRQLKVRLVTIYKEGSWTTKRSRCSLLPFPSP